ncbi:MAG: hypothetical protein IKR51_03720 [Oscillospiraceae bacterium]|nr:hypothetical protein [Oscillospiraceae bacterium]
MNKLFESLQYIDDEMLTEEIPAAAPKRTWVRWGAAAACLVIAVGAVALLHKPAPEPAPVGGDRPIVPVGIPGPEVAAGDRPIVPGGVPEDRTGAPETKPSPPPMPGAMPDDPAPDVLAWNTVDYSAVSVDMSVASVGEPLTKEQLAECLPEIRPEWMSNAEGYAIYWLMDGSGGLAWVELRFTDAERGWTIRATLVPEDAVRAPAFGLEPEPDERVSSFDGHEYRAYRAYYDDADGVRRVWMGADFEKDGIEYTLTTDVVIADRDELYAAIDLRDVMLAYMTGTHYTPDLSGYQYGEYVLIDRYVTVAEAREDPDFGAYVPAASPAGLEDDFARRYKFEDAADYLLVSWMGGSGEAYGDLQWIASPVTDEALTRVVSPDEREKYDVSLYPIPWATSVPREDWMTFQDPVFRIGDLTRELVEARAHASDDGPVLTHFSVLYDTDVLVRVVSKGVEPEWLYETLKSLG